MAEERSLQGLDRRDHLQIQTGETRSKSKQDRYKSPHSKSDRRDNIQILTKETPSKSLTGHKRPLPNPYQSDLIQFQTGETTLKSKQYEKFRHYISHPNPHRRDNIYNKQERPNPYQEKCDHIQIQHQNPERGVARRGNKQPGELSCKAHMQKDPIIETYH